MIHFLNNGYDRALSGIEPNRYVLTPSTGSSDSELAAFVVMHPTKVPLRDDAAEIHSDRQILRGLLCEPGAEAVSTLSISDSLSVAIPDEFARLPLPALVAVLATIARRMSGDTGTNE